MVGWIKLHRKILDNEFWLDEEEPFCRRAAWIDLLLLANHKSKKILFDGKVLEVKRGQLVTSVRKLSERWGWSPKKTLGFLRALEELEMLTKKSDSRKTVLTLINYEFYQDAGNADDNAEETPRKRRLPTNKNIKNIKNEKNIYSKNPFNQMIHTEYDVDAIEKRLLEENYGIHNG